MPFDFEIVHKRTKKKPIKQQQTSQNKTKSNPKSVKNIIEKINKKNALMNYIPTRKQVSPKNNKIVRKNNSYLSVIPRKSRPNSPSKDLKNEYQKNSKIINNFNDNEALLQKKIQNQKNEIAKLKKRQSQINKLKSLQKHEVQKIKIHNQNNKKSSPKANKNVIIKEPPKESQRKVINLKLDDNQEKLINTMNAGTLIKKTKKRQQIKSKIQEQQKSPRNSPTSPIKQNRTHNNKLEALQRKRTLLRKKKELELKKIALLKKKQEELVEKKKEAQLLNDIKNEEIALQKIKEHQKNIEKIEYYRKLKQQKKSKKVHFNINSNQVHIIPKMKPSEPLIINTNNNNSKNSNNTNNNTNTKLTTKNEPKLNKISDSKTSKDQKQESKIKKNLKSINNQSGGKFKRTRKAKQYEKLKIENLPYLREFNKLLFKVEDLETNTKNKKKYRNFSFYNCNSELPKPVSKLPRMKEIKIILDKNNIFHNFKHISKEITKLFYILHLYDDKLLF